MNRIFSNHQIKLQVLRRTLCQASDKNLFHAPTSLFKPDNIRVPQSADQRQQYRLYKPQQVKTAIQ